MNRLLIGMLMLALAGCAGTGSSSFKKGEALLSAGDYDQAVAAYTEALKKNPDKAEYRMRLTGARQKASVFHARKAEELMARQDYRGALREYQVAASLDGSIETNLMGVHEASLYIKAVEQVEEASKLLRDRHFRQARQLVDETLRMLPAYLPALELRTALDKRASTMIDGVELEVTSDEPITLNFKSANLPDVFDILTQLSGIRFILDDAIRNQTTTLYLEGATFSQAFELLLRMNKLDKKILNSKTIILFPNSNDKQKQFADQIIQTFYLSNIDAKKAVNLLRTMLQVRKIYVHEELNAIVLRDTPEVVRLAQKIIEANDRSTSEVVFDLELVEVSHTNDLEIGPKLSAYSIGVGLQDPTATSLSISDSVVLKSLNNQKFLYSVPSATYNFKKETGDAEILASPKIRVKNNGKAKVHIGSREPVVTVTINDTQTSENIQYVDVGVKLDVEPVIQLDNTIVTKLGLEVSNVSDRSTTSNGTAVLTISTTNANTDLILKDGEQTIIGGLLRDDKSKSKAGIPILSDIPLLGALFTSYTTTKTKREILLSITPHIVRAIRLPEGDSASIYSGGEDDLRVGRNFGSFSEEYLEGQGKTQPRVAPAVSTELSPMSTPSPADAVADALVEAPEQAEPPVEVAEPETPASPAVRPEPKSPTEPAVTPPPVQKPETAAPVPQPSSGGVAPAPATPVQPTPAQPSPSDVPEVVLPGLKTPEAIVRPTIFIEGDRLVNVGSDLTLNLSVQDVKDLFSAPLYIRFDPKLVDFVSASEGDFLRQGNAQTIFTSTLMADSGRVIVGLKQGAGGEGVSGGGVLARLVFKAKAPGKLSIAPERINFRNPAGERLPIDSRGLVVEVR